MKRPVILAATAILLVLGFVVGAYWYKEQQHQQTTQLARQNEGALQRAESPSMGPLTAKVQVVEFFDPACEACRAFYPYVKQIMETNARSARLTLRYANFHQGSEYVSRALEAARLQGQEIYWKSLEAALAAQPQWADHARPQPETIWNHLGGTGLDIERAKRDMNDPRIARLMEQDAADIAALGVRQTPTFFINGQPLREYSPDGLSRQIEEARKE